MNFQLRDGKAFWAKYKVSYKDKEKDIVEYIYLEEEKEIMLRKIENYEIEELPLPPQVMVERAKEIEGKTYSKSEFEIMLYEKTQEEKLLEENEAMKQSIAELSSMMFMLAPKE